MFFIFKTSHNATNTSERQRMGLDLNTAKEMLYLYINAEKAILRNQSYKIADKELKRADLRDIRSNMQYWKKQVEILDPTIKRKQGMQVKQVSYNYVD